VESMSSDCKKKNCQWWWTKIIRTGGLTVKIGGGAPEGCSWKASRAWTYQDENRRRTGEVGRSSGYSDTFAQTLRHSRFGVVECRMLGPKWCHEVGNYSRQATYSWQRQCGDLCADKTKWHEPGLSECFWISKFVVVCLPFRRLYDLAYPRMHHPLPFIGVYLMRWDWVSVSGFQNSW